MKKIEDKVAELAQSKPWILEEEREDVISKLNDLKQWLADIMDQQD